MSPKRTQFAPSEGLDPTWINVDAYTFGHLHPASRPNSAALEQTLKQSYREGLPPIHSSRPLGKFLALQCRIGGVKHALDVGTLGGYSAIWMATENPGLRVTSLEFSPKHVAVARRNIEAAGVADRVDVRVGPAVDTLPAIAREIDAGTLDRVGFTFIDADKLNNYTYAEWAVRLGYPGASIVVDNVVHHGEVLDEELARGWEHVGGARDVIERIGRDDRVEAVVLQVVGERNYDGFLMAVVK
ncbi:O-methyltransferase-like protein family 3 [Phyllosticta citrichinensis]|uniref:O-methyltransferase-like protein family 3 n=1 Tax=Phyllosticta citrichinensis TaxID=1130410 RepID=A0ABR1XVD5_9PEZI